MLLSKEVEAYEEPMAQAAALVTLSFHYIQYLHLFSEQAKSLDTLIDEFREGSGTHYGPDSVAVLGVPQVHDRLQYLVTEGREEMYYRVYTSQEL